MAKQLNVDLNIKANTGDAKKQIMDLQQALAKVTSNGLNGQQMKDAAAAAKELQMHLSKAVNVDTGKLNLNAFNTSLKQSGSNVQTLSAKLLTAGTTGQTAFVKLAQSIAAADRPIVTMNSHLSTFFTTLKNTARWQISSSILHGFMGTIQSAYGYAQDLNESLNNIRIVTGQSTEDMAKFAEQANKAAKALSTTTTAYTDAALIYYQQGLKGKEVTDRADVTIKLANVSRQSAEEVSSQMTAIWNNFYDGSQSLEYYADVITKLGASTASSSDEIAQGLQKFAAVADTVGLSYEKATAALATVVAETRQSADVVGTAFKTMFARFQGLSLGETLEDGVDLNKYSKALATIGVNILDANGELKKMDLILDETAQKWNQISEAQRVALAETVAGTRQYAQFMAVMNNYDKIQSNQKLAEGSTGSLQSQQNIYAESWEAASKRVKAAAEGLYDSLLDDEFFIKATNLIGTVINGINDFIKGLGGVKPLLIGISGILLNLFAGKIAQGAENLKINLTTMFQTPMQQAKEYAKTFQETVVAAQEKFGINFEKASFSDRTALTNANALAQAKNKAMIASKDLSAAEQQAMEIELSVIEAQMQVTQSVADSIDTEREHISTLMDEMTAQEAISQIEALRKEELRALTQEEADALAALRAQDPDDFAGILEAADAYEKAQIATANFKEETNQLISTQENINAAMREAFETLLQYNAGVGGAEEVTVDLGAHLGETTQQLGTLAEGLRQGSVSQGEAIQQMVSYRNEIQTLGIETDEVKQAFDNFTKVQKDSKSTAKDYASAVEKIQSVLKNLKITAKSTGESFKGFRDQLVAMEGGIKNVAAMEKSYNSLSKKTKELKEAQELLNNALKEFNPAHMQSGLEIVSKLSGSIMSASMVINSFKSAIDALNNQDMSFGEKLTTIMMSLGMGIPSAISAFQAFSKVITINSAAVEGLNKIIQANLAVEAANAAAKEEQIALLAQESSLRWMRISAQKLSTTTTLEETAADQAAKAVKAGLIAEEQEQAVAEALVNAVKEKGGSITQQEIAQILLETGVKEGSTTATKANIVVRLAHAIAARTEASAITSVWLALGLLAVIIAAVAAAIWGLIKLVKMSIDAWNADAIAAEKAAKTAQDLADAATEAKDRLNDIKTAVDSYKSVVDKLNDCTKGTKEWNEALEEVHAQISELLQKYPELLSEADLFNEDGTLNIDVLERFEQKAQDVATAANAAALQGSVDAAQARLKSNTTDASRKYEYYDEYGAYNMGHKDGTFSTVRSDLEKLLDTYKTTGSQALELTDVYDALGDITDDYAKSIMSLAKETVAATNAMNNAAKIAIDEWAAVNGKDLEAGQSTLMTEAYDQAYETFKSAIKEASDKNAKSDNKDHSKLGSAFDDTQFAGMSVTEAFNAARGVNYGLDRNGVRGTANNRTYAYLENGEVKEYTLAEMQATIAAAAALEKMGQAAEDASKALAGMDDATKEFLGSGSLEGLTSGEFKAYRESLGLTEGQEVTADEAKQLLMDQGVSEGVAEQLKQDFANNLNIDWDSLLAQLPESLDSKITEGLSLANGEALVKTISKLNLGPAGKQAGETFVDSINTALGSIDPDQQQEALSQILAVDWSDWDAAKQVEQILKDFDGDIDAIDWEKLTTEMREAAFAFPDFNKLRDDIANVATVLNDLNFGKAIKDEDYKKLIDYNEAWKDLFITQADGSHKFIGNEQQMKQAMMEDLTEQKKQLDERAAAAKKLEDSDWQYGDNKEDKVNWGNVKEGSRTFESLNNLWNSDSGKALLEDLGYTQERIDELATSAPEELEAAFQAIANAMNTNYDLEAANWNESVASMASNYAELLEISGQITVEAFSKRVAEMATEVAQNATSLEELQTGLGQLGGTFNFGEDGNVFYDEYAQGLQNVAAQYTTCSEAALQYQNALNALNESTAENKQELEAAVKAAEDHLEVMIGAEEAAKQYGLGAESLAAQMHEIALKEGVSEKQALAMAIANQRMNKGVAALNKNWKDWKKTLSSTEKDSQDYADTLVELSKSVTDLVGWYDELNLDSKFVEKNMGLIEKASNGDVQSILELGAAVAQLEIQNANLNTTLADGLLANGGENAFSKWADDALSAQENFTNLQTVLGDTFGLIQSKMGELQNGASLQDILGGEGGIEAFVSQLNAYAAATGMTAQQMQSMLSSIGVTANVQSDYQQQEVTVPTYDEYSEVVSNSTQPFSVQSGDEWVTYEAPTWHRKTYTVPGAPLKTTGFVEVASISMEDNDGNPTPPQFTGKQAPAPSATGGKGGGGGGGGNKGTKAASHKHEVHRYSNEENAAKGLASTYDRISTAKDHAFGAERIRLMEKELTTLGKLKDAAAGYLAAIVGQGNVDKIVKAVYSGKNIGDMIKSGELGGTIAADFKSLFSGLDAAGKQLEYQVKDAAGNTSLKEEGYDLNAIQALFGESLNIELDSYGNIKNRDDIMNMLDRWNNGVEDWFSGISDTATEADENEKARRLAMIEAIRERIEQYGETAELIQDKVDEYLEQIYEMQQKNADIIAGKLEKQIRLTENELALLQNSIKLMGKNMYKTQKGMEDWFAAVWTTPVEEREKSAQSAKIAGEEAMAAWHKWQADEFNTEGINSEQALDIIASSRDAIQEAFDGIFEGIDEMSEHMGNTLDYWNDKIDKVTSAMEANASTLEHLQNVLGLLGRSADYKALGEILKGQLSVAEDQYAGAKTKAESSVSAYKQAYEEYKKLLAEDAQEAEWFKENTLDVLQAQMIEDVAAKQAALENVLEKVNAWFENEINRIYQESEDRLTGEWGSFDELDAAMQRQHNLADEYLTKTNQLYETGTLLRKLAQDIDKTDSAAAKAKLKAFSDEIELMKEQEQLNKTDLEIAKARYELLLAEIALEEAQNAKSTVRLQRDSEGNYGYVYTADQDKVADAEQNLADKQNDLYNLVLGQTQDYNEKIIQHTKERNEALADLDRKWLNGEITDEEEYHRIRQDITEKYNDLLEADYHSYYEAVKWLNLVGAEGQTEAWTNSFSNILYSQDTYAQKLEAESDNISSEIDKDMEWLNSQRDYYTEEAKVGNEELKGTIDEVTDANKALLEQLIGKDGKSGLVGGMSSATSAAINLTSAFASQYTQALETAKGYQEMLQALQAYEREILNFEGHDTGGDEGGGKSYTAYSKDGAQYTIGSERGIDFVENAKAGDTITGGDGSTWVKNSDGSVLISKNGVEYLYGASWPGEPAAPTVQQPTQPATPSLEKGQSVTVKTTATNFTRDGGYGTRMQSWVPGYTFTVMGVSGDEVLIGLNGQVTGWVRKSDLVGFRSGGYTGEFGNDGKLAMLHEKELVLNAADTENLLDAITIIREISSAIDLRAAAANMAATLASPGYGTQAQEIQQTVTIHAEFPNATDHTEIEEAFNTLINQATQYVARPTVMPKTYENM